MTSEPYMNEKNASNDPVWEQAVHWVLRQREDKMDAADWEAFTVWLEEKPAHGIVYDQALEADADLGVLGPESVPAMEPQTEQIGVQAANDNRPWWLGLGAAAAVLIAVVLFWPGQSEPQFATLRTGLGEVREVAIGPAITMTINGNSELAVNKTSRIVRMIDGEASFSVSSAIPGAIQVEVEDLVLVDVGTVFNVIRDDQRMRLAVTEGAVVVNPDRQQIRVEAGHEITMKIDDLSYSSRKVTEQSALAWKNKQLVFENQLVASLKADIERNLGISISLPEDLAEQKVTGTLSLTNDETSIMNDLAAILGRSAYKKDGTWVISD